MQEYFVEGEYLPGDVIELPADKAHHAFRVLKLNHETVRLVRDGTGFFAEAYQENGRGLARIIEQDVSINELPVSVTLCMALIRREKFELVLQKACELGVSRIVPFESSRCVVHDKADRSKKQTQRRNAILLEASEQCKRNLVPVCEEPVSFLELRNYRSEMNLAAYEAADHTDLRIFSLPEASSVTVVIGPEGGFSQEEMRWLSDQGFSVITLGNRILRAETAAITACALLGERYS
ncbi:MAG: 16S rRNA (uracil(1498)-N(3))-methyltransferase [Solobacterium sp.]|nr:16S rRNA (uracil(1498)-N(3))-methyltransferase [Solobacterium sp.]